MPIGARYRSPFSLQLARPATIRVSPKLTEAAAKPAAEVLAMMETSPRGLTAEEAAVRLEQHGPNEVAQEKQHGWQWRLLLALRNPLVILLGVLSLVSFLNADARAGCVMVSMVVLGVGLRFVQESRADEAAARLRAMIRVTATAIRNGQPHEVPLREVVPGDLVKLSAGDMIPADVRLIAAKDLFLIQSSLTGESMPVEKSDAPVPPGRQSPLECGNICFLGTSVESGAATAVVITTGTQTYFGSMAGNILSQQVQTSFDRGVNRFTWLMIGLMSVLVPLVFLINGVTKKDWWEAFSFALAVAVGLTPEMLPMIVSVCLSKGAMVMSQQKVIVKRLNSIQNLGAMDILCTDKTGTLTRDRVILERHCDVVQEESDEVLTIAFLISHFQTGLKNVLDRAILEHREVNERAPIDKYQAVDEIPFDFSRRIMSVVVGTPECSRVLLTKGAPEEVFRRSTHFELNGEILPIEPVLLRDLMEEYEKLSSEGFRVLAVARKTLESRPAYSKEDESNLVLIGYVAFLDPPKESAAPAIRELQEHGVTVKVLTGDNELVSRKVCAEVGLSTETMILGSQVETMADAELAEAAEKATLFVLVSGPQAADHPRAPGQGSRRGVPGGRDQ